MHLKRELDPCYSCSDLIEVKRPEGFGLLYEYLYISALCQRELLFIGLGGNGLNCCFSVLRYSICACSMAGSLPNWPFSTSSATIPVRAVKNALNSLASVSFPKKALASSIYWCNACKTASLSEKDERYSPGRGFSASCNMPWIKSLSGYASLISRK